MRHRPGCEDDAHYGKAVFGAAAAVGELSALGQDLNFLFRMERVAAAQGFFYLLSEAAHLELSPDTNSQSVGSFPLKGLEGEHAFFGR